MSKFISAVQAFVADENGVTAIEYALIAALIGIGVATAAGLLGDNISNAFTNIGARLTGALAG